MLLLSLKLRLLVTGNIKSSDMVGLATGVGTTAAIREIRCVPESDEILIVFDDLKTPPSDSRW